MNQRIYKNSIDCRSSYDIQCAYLIDVLTFKIQIMEPDCYGIGLFANHYEWREISKSQSSVKCQMLFRPRGPTHYGNSIMKRTFREWKAH